MIGARWKSLPYLHNEPFHLLGGLVDSVLAVEDLVIAEVLDSVVQFLAHDAERGAYIIHKLAMLEFEMRDALIRPGGLTSSPGPNFDDRVRVEILHGHLHAVNHTAAHDCSPSVKQTLDRDPQFLRLSFKEIH